MPRPFRSAIRRQVIDLIDSGVAVSKVALLLGVSESSAYRWWKQERIDRGLIEDPEAVLDDRLREANRKIRDLEEEIRILRKAAEAVEEVVRPKERYRLVAELAADGVRIHRACDALGVSRSGFYAWKAHSPTPRSIRHAWLTDLIVAIHDRSRGTYGAPRVHAELVDHYGVTVGHNTVSLLMRRAQIAGLPVPGRRGKKTPPGSDFRDLVRRDFARDALGQLWVTDITEHPTREGKLFCCVVLDAHSRKVVGWAIDSSARAELATNALGMAIESRHHHQATIIHADHGPQFTSWAFSERIRLAGLLPSLGTVGDAYDNAMIESFWARLQVELLNRRKWRTRVELANAIFEYIEGFYNRNRRHTSLGGISPIEFEKQHMQPYKPS